MVNIFCFCMLIKDFFVYLRIDGEDHKAQSMRDLEELTRQVNNQTE